MSDAPIDWTAFLARLSFRTLFPIDLRFDPELHALVVILHAPDIHDGTPTRVYHMLSLRDVHISDPTEAMGQIRRLVLRAITHEVDECMLFDGRQVRDPHEAEPSGRLVDRGITPLLSDAEAIAELRRTVQRHSRPGPAAENHAG